MWQSGDAGFVRQFFQFVRTHPRIGLLVYNQGLRSDGPFRLWRFPAAAGEIRRQLSSRRFLSFAPEQPRPGAIVYISQHARSRVAVP
jgi:hypothetical protein